MKRRRAAAPYAKALFELAKERAEAELRDFFARPWIPAPVKRAVATELAQRSSLYEDLGRVRAHVRTPVPLTDEEREMLSAKLGKALGSRQVVLEQIVDRAMLGGFIVNSDSVVLDGSLEGQLDRMRRRLAND